MSETVTRRIQATVEDKTFSTVAKFNGLSHTISEKEMVILALETLVRQIKREIDAGDIGEKAINP